MGLNWVKYHLFPLFVERVILDLRIFYSKPFTRTAAYWDALRQKVKAYFSLPSASFRGRGITCHTRLRGKQPMTGGSRVRLPETNIKPGSQEKGVARGIGPVARRDPLIHFNFKVNGNGTGRNTGRNNKKLNDPYHIRN